MSDGKPAIRSGVTREDVELYYRAFLDRAPENEDVVGSFLTCSNRAELAVLFAGSAEFANRIGQRQSLSEHQIFRGYVEADLAVFNRFPCYQGAGTPGFATNFLGGRFRTKFQAPLAPYDGVVEGYPIPTGGLQGETAEFIGMLRSVIDAKNSYRILECGAGYGPWLGIAAVAARQQGIFQLRLHGIEGDADHVAFMREHMADCDVASDQCELIHGAVGGKAGIAQWALVDDAAAVYGGRPLVDGNVDYLGERQTRTVDVQVYAVDDLLAREPEWDLVHIDIQGGEAEVCRAGIAEMTRRVRRLVIGTHSRALDGEVMAIFEAAHWVLENEKPTMMAWRPNAATLESMTYVDGAQVWRNPNLLPVSIL